MDIKDLNLNKLGIEANLGDVKIENLNLKVLRVLGKINYIFL